MSRSLSLVALALLVAGCDTSGPDPESVAGDLVVSLGESVETGGLLQLATEEHYPCLGYTLDLGVETGDGTVRVDVDGVRKPEAACATALGPATGRVGLGLGRGKSTRVEIRYRGQVDLYDVENVGPSGRIVAVRQSVTRLAE